MALLVDFDTTISATGSEEVTTIGKAMRRRAIHSFNTVYRTRCTDITSSCGFSHSDPCNPHAHAARPHVMRSLNVGSNDQPLRRRMAPLYYLLQLQLMSCSSETRVRVEVFSLFSNIGVVYDAAKANSRDVRPKN